MSEVMQRYINLAIHKENIERIQKMIGKGYSKEDILDLDYIEDEYTEAEAALLQKDQGQARRIYKRADVVNIQVKTGENRNNA